MRTATAAERHRAHDNRLVAFCVAIVHRSAWLLPVVPLVAGCGYGLPRPRFAPVSVDDYVAVPFSPRVPPVEFVPPSPNNDAVWIDGSWEWSGNRYGWRYGSWVVPPAGVRRTRWAIVRRSEDGQLFFAPATWKDASGKTVDDRSFATALGPAARARSRLGAPAPTSLPGGDRARPAEPNRPRPNAPQADEWFEDEGEE